MVSSLIDKETKHWKMDKSKRHFLPFKAKTILSILLSHNLPEDKIIWMGNKRGIFSVKSAYYVALPLLEKSELGECSSVDYRTLLWKKMWQVKLPSKIRIFAWRACMDGLSMRLNLNKRRINTEVK